MTKPRMWPNPDCDIHLFWHLQVVGGTSAAGKSHQIRSTFFICFPFGLQIHFALSFLPLLAFRPLLAKYESSLSEWMVSHIFLWYILFYLFIFQCGVFSCLLIVLARDGFPLRTGAVGPFLVLCLVLSCVTCTHAWWFLHGRDVPLFMWCVCCMLLWLLLNLPEMDYGLLDNGFVCMTSDSLTTLALCWPLYVVSCTILINMHTFSFNKLADWWCVKTSDSPGPGGHPHTRCRPVRSYLKLGWGPRSASKICLSRSPSPGARTYQAKWATMCRESRA